MQRRSFIGSLAAFAATMALDPERLLWLPGQKLISIPAQPVAQEFITLFANTGFKGKRIGRTFTRLDVHIYGEQGHPVALPQSFLDDLDYIPHSGDQAWGDGKTASSVTLPSTQWLFSAERYWKEHQ